MNLYIFHSLSNCTGRTSTQVFGKLMKLVIISDVFKSLAFAKAYLFLFLFLGMSVCGNAQQSQAPLQNIEYERALQTAQEEAEAGNDALAEAAYKKAVALNPEAAGASYNLGNLHFNKERRFEASNDYQAAAEAATTKEEKHKIYHNAGNTLFENKQFKEAVEAYKNALRNDPTDEETRYNLALAKKEEEKQGGGGGGGDDNQDKDEKEDGEDQDKNDQGDKDQNSDGNKDKGDDKKDGDQKEGDDGDKKEDEKGKNQDGKDGDGKPKEQDGKAPQRQAGKLTPQQARQLLEAMNNEEQKIQEKVNAKKAKGKAVKSEKDW